MISALLRFRLTLYSLGEKSRSRIDGAFRSQLSILAPEFTSAGALPADFYYGS